MGLYRDGIITAIIASYEIKTRAFLYPEIAIELDIIDPNWREDLPTSGLELLEFIKKCKLQGIDIKK
jgi:hypothetical protein